MLSETQVSLGVHPCQVLQKGHREENVTLSGSLSISARSISTSVGTNLCVFGHLNINWVNGASSRHWRSRPVTASSPHRHADPAYRLRCLPNPLACRKAASPKIAEDFRAEYSGKPRDAYFRGVNHRTLGRSGSIEKN
jgi:hypothetical protein